MPARSRISGSARASLVGRVLLGCVAGLSALVSSPATAAERIATAERSARVAGVEPPADGAIAVPMPRPRPITAVQHTASLAPAAVPLPRARPVPPGGTVATAPAGLPAPSEPAGPSRCGENGKLVRSAFYWQGTKTASGQRFDPDGFTAAHRTLPFGTKVKVTNPRTGRSVEVVVNDRGPFTPGLHIDISRGAARAIGLQGTGTVCLL